MRRTFLAALVALLVSACGETADPDLASDRVPLSGAGLSAAEVDAVYRAILGGSANDIVQPDRSDPVHRNMVILRDGIDPQVRGRNVERNLEVLRRRIDPPSTTL